MNNSEIQGALFTRPTKTNKAKTTTHKNKNVSNTANSPIRLLKLIHGSMPTLWF
jgi:hypothetical protein